MSADHPKVSALWNDGTPILSLASRPNITVRHFRPTDAAAMSKQCNNYKLWINLRDRIPHPYTPEAAQNWIDFNLDPTHWVAPDFDEGQRQADDTKDVRVPTDFVICEDDTVIGAVGLAFGSDVSRRTAELGYWLGEEHWGKGIMTDVVAEFTRWAFDTFGRLVRLHAEMYAWNSKSVRVLQKCGFTIEGTHRCAVWKAGELVDLIVLGKVREGYEGTTVQPERP